MNPKAQPVHQRYLDLVDEIEQRFDVARWRSGDVDLWPPARVDLFLDLFKASGAESARPAPPFLRRALGNLATPATNAWKSRRDLQHWLPRPKRADTILLGDGVSHDKIDGAWRDRHGEPVMTALERRGRTCFLMQPGSLDRLPWARPTYAANGIAVRAALAAALRPTRPVELPDHAAIVDFLAREGVQAPCLDPRRLIRRARTIAAGASQFQRVLRAVRPRQAFVVTYYVGLGHAFVLACRREGVLSVDLQHCPQGGAHRGYRWKSLPAEGYSTLPGAFWTWTAEEAASVEAWARTAWPWHRAVHGGHAQLTAFLDEQDASARLWDERFAAMADRGPFEREILVALQPIGGKRAAWEALARQIETAPNSWRWWIRRHPSSTAFQDAEYRPLLAPGRPNVVVDQASALPLPALLRRMSVVVSLASGASAEAAAFGVPSLFFDEEALALFPGLLERGDAELIDVADVASRIAGLPATPKRIAAPPPPPIAETLERLDGMAEEYAGLRRTQPLKNERRG